MTLRRSAAKQAGLPSVVQVRLAPSLAQAEQLTAAVKVCNASATLASRTAWRTKTFGQLALHHLMYRELRAVIPGLGAQAAVRAIARVADIYANRRSSKKRAHIFRQHGAVPYDARMITFNAMEDLAGIRGRVRAHRSQRRTLHGWAFTQQINFTRYKAARAGVSFSLVDPAYTSQTCPLAAGGCGHISKRNRPTRGLFRCQTCGLAGHADHIAAINQRQRAEDDWGAVNRPHATGLPSPRRAPESKTTATSSGR